MLKLKRGLLQAGSILFGLILMLGWGNNINSQDKIWNGKKSAVALTYDDALNVHLDNVIPILDSLGFNGTFYLAGSFPGLQPRLEDWREAAAKGNELGNHSIFHPCRKSLPGRDWVSPDEDLDKYSHDKIKKEIVTMNTLLEAIDGKTKRTYAYPCGEFMINGESYVPIVKENFVGARGVENKMQTIDKVDLYDIGCYMIDESMPADQLKSLVDEAIEKDALLVFLFHGVGGEHSINVPLNVHNELLRYLKDNENDIWVAPLEEIAEYIEEQKKQ